MQKLMIIFLALLVMVLGTACGRNYDTAARTIVEPAKPCTVVKIGNTSTITCPDGTQTTITDGSNGNDGNDGTNGQDGSNGSNGHSAAFSQSIADVSLCANGGAVINMGIDLNDDSVLQLAETKQTAIVCNGLNGTNGQNAPPSPFSPVSVVNPCGDAPSIDDEVFLRLGNGQLLWSQSDNIQGYNTRFSLGRAGTWQTTDGDACIFTLDANYQITYENKHY